MSGTVAGAGEQHLSQKAGFEPPCIGGSFLKIYCLQLPNLSGYDVELLLVLDCSTFCISTYYFPVQLE